jgi:penicillin-binding protein 1A
MFRVIKTMISFFIKTGFIFFSFLAALAIGFSCVILWQVFYGDYSSLEKKTILSRIQEETSIFYLDGTTRIGSLFENHHRRYIAIDEIPPHMLNAMVAAEDGNFYHHFGIDPIAIGKAAFEGIMKGGRFKRGGSSITQQTVKNIVDDWETSFARKFREMIKALQLERIYSKGEILEFYLNQFHVAGNGNGIGIGAKYYFNKEVKELDLVESAFIAGSVKGPSKYNPFIKYTKAAKIEAEKFAQERKNYVLERMFIQGFITKSEYEEGIKIPVPFNRGEFRTAEVALVDLIKSQLVKKELLDALGLKKPSDLNIAGLKVYTTIDAAMQEAAQLAMRKNLSKLETILTGFATEKEDLYVPLRHLKANDFHFSKVEEILGTSPKDYQIRVSFGIPSGIIPNESLVRYAKLLDLSQGVGFERQLTKMITAIKPGDILFTQILSYDEKSHEAQLEFQKYPKISGGLIALDKGEVRAVISGFDTLGFNRAMYAARQPGSVFKSLTYFAALQLGWTVLDTLDNTRQVFPYQGRLYFPRPDHISPYEQTSMIWAGTMSENLSTVALGYRLTEKLTFENFKSLLTVLGLAPKDGELPRDYHYRVAKTTGVTPDQIGFMAFQLQKAIEDMASDLIFDGEQALLKRLKHIWWGSGYVSEAKRQISDSTGKFSQKEISTRIALLHNNYERFKKLAASAKEDWESIRSSVNNDLSTDLRVSRFRVLGGNGSDLSLAYYKRLPDETYLGEPLKSGRPLDSSDIQSIWADESFDDISISDVKIDGFLKISLLEKIEKDMLSKYEEFNKNLAKSPDPYQLQRYYQHHDFRIATGLYYMVQLARRCGVFNPMDPVLSMPLGSNAVTASEVAKIYQTFVTGQTFRFYEEGPDNQINFIRRIEDRSGKVLFETKPKAHELVKPEIASQMHEILEKTVTHGTGRRARGELFMTLPDDPTAYRIPAFGKTGSTNDWRTSYFAGFFPYPSQTEQTNLDPKDSYVIASYVGYDWNQSMVRGRQKIYGSNGGLPLWVDFAKELIAIQKYSDHFLKTDQAKKKAQWNMKIPPKTSPLLVDLPRGLVLREGSPEDGEAWEATNLSKTGESYQNLFLPNKSVQSIVYLPRERYEGFTDAYRVFAPFQGESTLPPEPQPVSGGEEADLPETILEPKPLEESQIMMEEEAGGDEDLPQAPEDQAW